MGRLSTTAREALYRSVLAAQQAAGIAAQFPLCNICGLEIGRGRKWHESHMPAPHAITGAPADGVAHARCNLERAWTHDIPLIAHCDRVRQKDIGAFQTRTPLPGGKDDPRKRTMAGPVVDRRTGEPWGAPRNSTSEA
jgi:hypothetical protein